MKNTYRIYTKSTKNPRTINTPMMGRTNYDITAVEGKESFIAKLNELIAAGEQVIEVRYGFGGTDVNFYKYITAKA